MIQTALARFHLVEFPLAALVLFMLAWVAIVVQAWAQSPAELERLRALPLDDSFHRPESDRPAHADPGAVKGEERER